MRTPAQERAVAAYLTAHRGLVIGLIGPYFRGLSDEDAEELEGDALAAMARAFEDYQAGHESGATLETLASRYIRAVLANHRRLKKTPTAKARREERSFSEIVHTFDDGSVTRLGDTLEAPDSWAPLDGRLTLDGLADTPTISPRQAAALALRREGAGFRKVAAALDISESGAHALIKRAEGSARRTLGVAARK